MVMSRVQNSLWPLVEVRCWLKLRPTFRLWLPVTYDIDPV